MFAKFTLIGGIQDRSERWFGQEGSMVSGLAIKSCLNLFKDLIESVTGFLAGEVVAHNPGDICR